MNYVALGVFALVAFAGYYVNCLIWPYVPCRKCKGSGRLRAPVGRAFGNCTRCNGSGRRTRTGRRLIDQRRR